MKFWPFLKKSKVIHDAFEAGVTIKLIDGILEIIGGVLLIFINPPNLNRWVDYFIQSKLFRGSQGAIANFLLYLAGDFTVKAQIFDVVYLLVHGIIKIFLVVNLWEKKMWAYPTAMVFFLAFILYQTYEYVLEHSVFMLALTILDILVVLFTWVEYERLKDRIKTSQVRKL